MPICGICTKQHLMILCNKCGVCICDSDTCKREIVLVINQTEIKSYCICKICYSVSSDTMIFNKYIHCRNCDSLVPCDENHEWCRDCDKLTIKPRRTLLPHQKAKPIIEEIYDIKGIAQIIFDYYYKPRRYYMCEM